MITVFMVWFKGVWSHPWVRQIALVLGAALAFLIGKEAYDRKVRAGEARRNDMATKNREQAATIETLETSAQVKEDIRHDRDAAIEAGNSLPGFSSPDELRKQAPEIASVIFRSGG